MIYNDVTKLVGHTPMVKLNKVIDFSQAKVFAKLEFYNPLSSVKDRIGVNMILEAEKAGKINKDTIIVEPTSGNTGIGLSFMCAVRGYSLIIFMPENFSIERQKIMKALGAKIFLTPADKGIPGAIKAAENFKEKNRNVFMPQQFKNSANPEIHYLTTGPEIWQDTQGDIDIFVAGVGTGGTITGTGKFLKKMNANIKIVAIEPLKSDVLSGGQKGFHSIQGIGAGFIPSVLDTHLLDEVIRVSDEDALKMVKRLPREEGLFVGISAAAAAWASVEVAKRQENKGKTVVTIFPDSGDRYLSNNWFDD